MHSLLRGPARRLAGGVFWLVLAFGLGPRAEAAKFVHASLGSVEVYSSDSPDDTKRLLGEILEIRRQVQMLVAPAPVPNPRLQILIFSRQADYEAFLPARASWEKEGTRVSGFRVTEFGLVGAIVQDAGGYTFGLDSLRYFYASYLLQAAVPNAPLWVKVGLPEFLAGTQWRGKEIYIGDDFMDHKSSVRLGKLLPLAQLMNSSEMARHAGDPTHNTPLYHEAWALWHRWLTDPDPKRRAQIQRLFTAIREGHGGDLTTVTECFGETAEAIDAARRSTPKGKGFPVVVGNPNPAALVPGLAFAPATELDAVFAQSLLAGSMGQGPQELAYKLYRVAQQVPTSPRPPEGLAVLAMGENDWPRAEARWEDARALETTNAFAYLSPARAALNSRQMTLEPKPRFPADFAAQQRGYLDKAVALDAGCGEAYYLRAMVEAYAPDPQAAALDAVEQSGALTVRPHGYIFLALARWRLGQIDHAKQALAALNRYRHLDSAIQTQARVVRDGLERSLQGKK